jgi:mannose/fructose/N-acetylgalactosamine-specific phosphotransferase system component IIB
MIVLLRIDDRLIHGQVVIGWAAALSPDRIVVADDDVAADEWERNLYAAAAGPELKVSVLSLKEAAEHLRGGVFDRERVIVLVRHPRGVAELMRRGLEVREVNVGGLHFRPGTERIAEGVFVDDEERSVLRSLVKSGVRLDGRALPTSVAVTLNSRVV